MNEKETKNKNALYQANIYFVVNLPHLYYSKYVVKYFITEKNGYLK